MFGSLIIFLHSYIFRFNFQQNISYKNHFQTKLHLPTNIKTVIEIYFFNNFKAQKVVKQFFAIQRYQSDTYII